MQKAEEHDEEGRLIMLEFDTFSLINVYVSQLAAARQEVFFGLVTRTKY